MLPRRATTPFVAFRSPTLSSTICVRRGGPGRRVDRRLLSRAGEGAGWPKESDKCDREMVATGPTHLSG